MKKEGLVYNKVNSQVGVPGWVFGRSKFLKWFLRGFFDTDGSVYKLKFGIQISFKNKSLPLLKSVERALKVLGYHPSKVSAYAVYLTRRKEVLRFFRDILPANVKHRSRFATFIK